MAKKADDRSAAVELALASPEKRGVATRNDMMEVKAILTEVRDGLAQHEKAQGVFTLSLEGRLTRIETLLTRRANGLGENQGEAQK